MGSLHANEILYRRGGAEASMLNLAWLQRPAGHAVEVWGMDHPENADGPHLAGPLVKEQESLHMGS